MKMSNEKFIKRFNSKQDYLAYMLDVMPNELRHLVETRDGLGFAQYLEENIFNKTTYSIVKTNGGKNYVKAELDSVDFNKKEAYIEKLTDYGFFKTGYKDIETYMWIPPMMFDLNKFNNGKLGTSTNQDKQYGANTIIKKLPTRPKK
jgi:hypothetical protein